MIEILIRYFAISVCTVTVFYILGGIIFNLLKLSFDNSFLKLFSHLLCGIIVGVFIYSIIITRFNTIMIGLLIPFIFILSFNIRQIKKREKLLVTLFINGKIILLSILVLLLVCGYNLYFLWDIDKNILVPPEADKVFYARVCDYLNYSGHESAYLDYSDFHHTTPYHYFELWLTAIIIRLPGLNTLLVQQIILNSIFFLTLYIGGLSLVNYFKKITVFDIFLCLILPFFFGIRIPIFPSFLYHHDDWYFFENPIIRQKLFGISILFIASALMFMRKRLDIALCFLLIGCFFNVSLIITVPIVVIIFCLIIKQENKLKILICSILILIFYYAFYSLNKTKGLMLDNPSLPYMIKNTLSSIKNFKLALNIIAKSIVEIVLLFFPFIFILFYLKKKDLTIRSSLIPLSIFVILLYILSASVWAIFIIKPDSQQLFYYVALPTVNSFFFIVAIIFISKLNHWKLYMLYLALGIWGSICIIDTSRKLNMIKNKSANRYSSEYLHSVRNNLLRLNNQGGYLTKFESDNDIFMINFIAYSYKPYLTLIKNNINIILIQTTDNINLRDDSLYRSQQNDVLKLLLFNRYIQKQKGNNTFQSESKSRIDYIKENKLEYVIVDKNAIVDSLLQIITDTIITDNKSGERFMILKK